MQDVYSSREAPPFFYRMPDAIRVSGMSRSRIYRLLLSGDLKAKKAGVRLLIDGPTLREYVASLPEAKFRAPRPD